jgi:hypothetical protein
MDFLDLQGQGLFRVFYSVPHIYFIILPACYWSNLVGYIYVMWCKNIKYFPSVQLIFSPFNYFNSPPYFSLS